MTKRTNRSYTAVFKQEAVALVTEQGYSVPKAAASLASTVTKVVLITNSLPLIQRFFRGNHTHTSQCLIPICCVCSGFVLEKPTEHDSRYVEIALQVANKRILLF